MKRMEGGATVPLLTPGQIGSISANFATGQAAIGVFTPSEFQRPLVRLNRNLSKPFRAERT